MACALRCFAAGIVNLYDVINGGVVVPHRFSQLVDREFMNFVQVNNINSPSMCDEFGLAFFLLFTYFFGLDLDELLVVLRF